MKQLREIIKSASRKPTTLDDAIRDMPPLTRFVFILFRELSSVLDGILGFDLVAPRRRKR